MDDTHELERRLTDLEIKASFTEDLIDRLNEVIVRQQAQLETLARELAGLRRRTDGDGGAAPRSLREELPPHY